MNVPQIYAFANAKSGYSRPDAEIYDAINEGGFRVYSATLKEFGGFFIKFDEASLTLLPGTTEYTMPADLSQIVHLAERVSSSEDWHPMSPLDLDSVLSNQQIASIWDANYAGFYGTTSAYGYYGPYLDSTATQAGGALQIQKIRISPGVDQTRHCQLAYNAKWLPVTDASSKIMLPDEGTYAALNYAIAELRRASDDSASRDYEAKGDRSLSDYLAWARARQIQQFPTVKTYGPSF